MFSPLEVHHSTDHKASHARTELSVFLYFGAAKQSQGTWHVDSSPELKLSLRTVHEPLANGHTGTACFGARCAVLCLSPILGAVSPAASSERHIGPIWECSFTSASHLLAPNFCPPLTRPTTQQSTPSIQNFTVRTVQQFRLTRIYSTVTRLRTENRGERRSNLLVNNEVLL